MSEMPERIWANPDAGYCTAVGPNTYTTEYIRADLAAVAEREPVVAAWQFKHYDPISGNPVWKTTLYWNGHRATEYRPLYLDPPPTSELEALRKRVAELEREREEDLAARETELEVSFDNGHYRAMSEHATPWQNRAEAAEARVAELEKALDGLLEPFEGDDCRYDHHGYCQSHFLQDGDECCVKVARRVREGGKVDG